MSDMSLKSTVQSPQVQALIKGFMGGMKPRPRVKVSVAAEQVRYLSQEASAQPGPWRNANAPYLVEPMDIILEPWVHTVVLMFGSQTGKSECINNITFYYPVNDPCPMMMLQPTLATGEDYSKRRLSTSIRDSAILRELFGEEEAKSRKSGNTILAKTFPGGILDIVGSNSPAGLASKPIRILLCDEIDRYEVTKEGDAIELAWKRASSYFNRKRVLTSTPTRKGQSAIERWAKMGDMRKFFVRCPHCGEEILLQWRDPSGRNLVVWDTDENGELVAGSCRFVCSECGVLFDNTEKNRAVKGGRWKPTQAPKDPGVVSYCDLPEFYALWKNIEDTVRDFLRCKDDSELLRVWVNTALGQVWEEESDSIESDEIYGRREPYGLIVPMEAALVTATVDVQDDRLEVLTRAWGRDERSWAMEHVLFRGDPGVDFKRLKDPNQATMFDDTADDAVGVWRQLDLFLEKLYDHESGARLPISITLIDSGGHHTDQVYSFVRNRERRRIYAIKGDVGHKPIVNPPSKSNKGKIKLFTIGVNAAKDLVLARLKINTPERPGYMHYPDREGEDGEGFTVEFFRQLTAEKKVVSKKNGQFKVEWVQIRKRNEAWDLEVYSLAAIRILCPSRDVLNKQVDKLIERMNRQDHAPVQQVERDPLIETRDSRQRRDPRRRGGFVKNW